MELKKKKSLKIILAQPRGFCAGVERAIEIVERALKIYGPPVYVRHEIVHNKRVVNNLSSKGAVFVKELDQIPQGAVTVFSAHGVSQKVEDTAGVRKKKNVHDIEDIDFYVDRFGAFYHWIFPNQIINEMNNIGFRVAETFPHYKLNDWLNANKNSKRSKSIKKIIVVPGKIINVVSE